MYQYKYNILLSVLTISILLFSACGSSEDSNAQTRPEDEFNSVSEDYQYACDNLNAYITDAHNLMDAIPDTDINDECIAKTYEELSDLLKKSEEAAHASVPRTMASDEDGIRQQIQQIREHSDTVSSLYYELESAISNLESCMQELAETRTANQVTLKPAYTGTAETGNGYKAEYTISITDWIRASDGDALQLAWENAGGKDTVPSMDNFHEHTNDGFSTQNAAVAFGTISFCNITEGYDITESNPIAFTVPLRTDKDVISGKMGYAKLYIGYTEPKYIDLWEYPSISCLMKRNTWGPVVLMFVFPDAFTPNNPQGHPELDGYKIYFEYYTGDKYMSISYPAVSDNNANDG